MLRASCTLWSVLYLLPRHAATGQGLRKTHWERKPTERGIYDRGLIGPNLDDSHLFAKLNQDLEESKTLRDILVDELYLVETGPVHTQGPKILRSTHQESSNSMQPQHGIWKPVDVTRRENTHDPNSKLS